MTGRASPPKKFYPTGGSGTVRFYTVHHQVVHVTFCDGRTRVSKTLRSVDSLRKALLCGSLTTMLPVPAEETVGSF